MTDFTKEQLEFINLLKTTDQPQGKDTLCSSEGFCCLGLGMAHFRDKLGIDFNFAMTENEDAVVYYSDDEQKESVALYSFVKLLKLYTKTGSARNAQHLPLVSLNDREWTFKEIGEHLENYPEAYFTNFTEENNND